VSSRAQQTRAVGPTMGLLISESIADWMIAGVRKGLGESGFVEGQNLVVTGRYSVRAERIAEKLIHDLTARNDWRLAEHYNDRWEIDPDYSRDDPDNMFRTFGSVVGQHAQVGQAVHLVAVEDVCYLQSADKYTLLLTRDAEMLLRTPLKELIARLWEFWDEYGKNRERIGELIEAGVTDRVTVSIGVALGLAADEPIAEIVERADRALYAAKRTGRDRVIEAWPSEG